MPALDTSHTVGVIGAGTMGAGIAQVAAAAGHPVLLFDVADGAVERGIAGIAKALERVVSKGRMEAAERDALIGRIMPCAAFDDLKPAALVIEAVVENLDVKRKVFADLEALLGPDAILASNTSSLSVTAMGAELERPGRLVGAHFFNPAPLMALVEVISGLATERAVAETTYETMAAWGKSPVHCRSTPGFIANRVARPYYAEALRLLAEGAADVATVDAVLREAGGFRMGAFELMDLVGNDVNYTVTCSIFDLFYQDPRYTPSLDQKELVDAGFFGRKSGRGFYDYAEGAERPAPATAEAGPAPGSVVVEGDLGPAEALVGRLAEAGVACERGDGGAHEGAGHHGLLRVGAATLALTDGRGATQRAHEDAIDGLVLFDLALDYGAASRLAVAAADQAGPDALADAAGLLQAAGIAVSPLDDVPGLVLMRAIVMLANIAAEAVYQDVADAAGIDTAMLKGLNYPRGPLTWSDTLGADAVCRILDNLATVYGEDRYRASALLRRKALGGGRFHD
jgi:3-hydroxybutyryl-CoA dehydrogenase